MIEMIKNWLKETMDPPGQTIHKEGLVFNGQTIVSSVFEQSNRSPQTRPKVGSKCWYSYLLRRNVHESEIYEDMKSAVYDTINKINKSVDRLKDTKEHLKGILENQDS